jgi:hypothetical protein
MRLRIAVQQKQRRPAAADAQEQMGFADLDATRVEASEQIRRRACR